MEGSQEENMSMNTDKDCHQTIDPVASKVYYCK